MISTVKRTLLFLHGIGVVRIDSYDKKDRLTYSQILQEVTLP